MSTEEWVEDENHRTINGERWVVKLADGKCNSKLFPTCDAFFRPETCKYFWLLHGLCVSKIRKDGRNIRWYRASNQVPAVSDNLNNDSAPKSKRPPIGLKPRYIHDHERYIEICGAIQRYYDAGKKIPVEWIEEYNELVEKEKCE